MLHLKKAIKTYSQNLLGKLKYNTLPYIHDTIITIISPTILTKCTY